LLHKVKDWLTETENALRETITGWAVALTCYISHSAKHIKMAEFEPSGSQNPWTDFAETWYDWLSISYHKGTHSWHCI